MLSARHEVERPPARGWAEPRCGAAVPPGWGRAVWPDLAVARSPLPAAEVPEALPLPEPVPVPLVAQEEVKRLCASAADAAAAVAEARVRAELASEHREVESRLAKLGANDRSRQNSTNASGFGRDISRWVNKQTVLPPNVLSLPLVGKNKGHPAVFPVDLPLFFIRLLCPEGGLVCDPFGGSGTTGLAALAAGRRSVLIDNNEEYCQAAVKRLREEGAARRHELLAEQTLFPVDPPKRRARRAKS